MQKPRLIPAVNNGNKDIPRGGLVALNGIDPLGNLILTAPSAASQSGLAIVYQATIQRNGGYGHVTFEDGVPIAFDPTTGTPGIGSKLGSQSGSFLAAVGNAGFQSISDAYGPWTNAIRLPAVVGGQQADNVVCLQGGPAISQAAAFYDGTPSHTIPPSGYVTLHNIILPDAGTYIVWATVPATGIIQDGTTNIKQSSTAFGGAFDPRMYANLIDCTNGFQLFPPSLLGAFPLLEVALTNTHYTTTTTVIAVYKAPSKCTVYLELYIPPAPLWAPHALTYVYMGLEEADPVYQSGLTGVLMGFMQIDSKVPVAIDQTICGVCGAGSGGSGSGGSGGNVCPTSGTLPVTFSGFTGACVALNTTVNVTYNAGAGSFQGSLNLGGGSIIHVTYVCLTPTSGNVTLSWNVSGGSGAASVAGTASPMNMTGTGSYTGGTCNGQTFSASVT